MPTRSTDYDTGGFIRGPASTVRSFFASHQTSLTTSDFAIRKVVMLKAATELVRLIREVKRLVAGAGTEDETRFAKGEDLLKTLRIP